MRPCLWDSDRSRTDDAAVTCELCALLILQYFLEGPPPLGVRVTRDLSYRARTVARGRLGARRESNAYLVKPVVPGVPNDPVCSVDRVIRLTPQVARRQGSCRGERVDMQFTTWAFTSHKTAAAVSGYPCRSHRASACVSTTSGAKTWQRIPWRRRRQKRSCLSQFLWPPLARHYQPSCPRGWRWPLRPSPRSCRRR